MSSPARSYFLNGIFIALLGAVCFSTKAVFVKLAYRDSTVDAVTLLALRMIFSVPFFISTAVVASRRESNVKFTRSQWAYVALIGCLGYYISSLLDFLGLQYVTAGIERLILFIYPTIVLLISAVIFKEKVNRIQWIALLATYAGLVLAFVSEVTFSKPDSNFYLGSMLIFICAITYAMYIVGSGKLIPVIGAAKFNSYAMTFASIGVILHFLITSGGTIFHLEPIAYGYSIAMAILGTVIPSYLVSEGIKRIGSDNAAIVGSIGPVSTILLAWYFLDESVSITQWLGTALIVLGVLLIGRQKAKKVEAAVPVESDATV